MKLITSLTFILGMNLMYFTSFSQGWEKSYGGAKDDFAYDVIKTSDGGFVAVGSTASFGAGGTDVFVVKINSSGYLKWTRVIGGTGNDVGYSIIESSSTGDLVIAGVTSSFGAGGNDVYLIRLTANGKTKWTKTFGSTGNDEARSAKFSGNNIYVTGSTTIGGSNSNFYLLKTESNGNLLWQKNYGPSGNENAYSMVKTFDGGFALAGLTTSYTTNRVYLVKVNANGDTLFTKNFDQGSLSMGATGITETTDNGLAMTGFNYHGTGYGDMFLMKVNSSGSVVFSQIGTALSNSGAGLTALNDGGVIAIGNYCNFGCTMELLKYNTGGTELWHKTSYQYANSNSYNTFSYGSAVKLVTNSSYIACGYTYLPSGSQADFLFVKTDSSGNSYTNPVLSYSGPNSFCAPGSVTMTAPAGYTSFQWTYVNTSHGLTYISGATSSSYTASSTGSYSCIMKSAMNDVNIAYGSAGSIETVPPVITLTGSASFCAATGQTLQLSTSFTFGYTYQWKLNGTNISGATSGNYSPTASGSYTVVRTNTCGTVASSPLSVNVTAPPATPVITASNGGFLQVTECNGSPVDYYGYIEVPQVPGATYQWYHNGTILSGATSYSTFPYVDNEDYTCTVTTSCGNATSAPYHVLLYIIDNTYQYPYASGYTTGCGVTSVTLSVDFFQDPYQWYKDGVAIPGANLENYYVTSSGNYHCEYYSQQCGFWQTLEQYVDINTGSFPSISAVGSTTVCTGTVTLNASPLGANSYSWHKDNVAISGATAASYVASSSGNYKCFIGQPCGQGYSNSIFISIGLPPNNLIYANATTICSSTSATFYVNPPLAGQTFQWKRNGGNIAGATSTTYSTNVAGSYVCNITNTCGTAASNAVSLAVNQSPVPVITGNILICPASGVTLTETSGTGTTYLWYNGNYSVGGGTQQTYVATAAGNYKVKVTAANGCSAFSNIITTTMGSLPAPSVSFSEYPVICSNENITMQTNSGTGYFYHWKKNGVNIAGATNAIYTASDSGSYSVTVTNTCGSVTAVAPAKVQLKDIPAATITPQGPTTFCAGGSVVLKANNGTGYAYSWRKNGAAINAATGLTYTATTAGTYKVIVTNNSSCSNASAGTVVTVPCKEGEILSDDLTNDIKASVYPNPFSESFVLFIEGDDNSDYTFSITDYTGRQVSANEKILPGRENQLGENLAPGYYLINVASGNLNKTLKIVKL